MPQFISNIGSAISESWEAVIGVLLIVAVIALAVAFARFWFGDRTQEAGQRVASVAKVLVAIAAVGAVSNIAQWAYLAG